MTKSKIEWTDEVWNPTVGCRRVSEGCRNCYAERMAKRLAAMGREEYQGLLTEGGRWNGMVRTLEDRLNAPSKWKKPRRVFVDSMSDLFHEDVPDDFIWRVFETIFRGNRRHTYIILTKRPERMQDWFQKNQSRFWHYKTNLYPNPCIWLGVSVENQRTAEERIPYLLRTQAPVRIVSCEPLLGPVDLTNIQYRDEWHWDALRGYQWKDAHADWQAGTAKINWVIAGGESGPGARPMHSDWVRSLRDQCVDAGVSFFFKQWGEYNEHGKRVGKQAAGRILDGRIWDEYPQVAGMN